jgi:hypothetical protein
MFPTHGSSINSGLHDITIEFNMEVSPNIGFIYLYEWTSIPIEDGNNQMYIREMYNISNIHVNDVSQSRVRVNGKFLIITLTTATVNTIEHYYYLCWDAGILKSLTSPSRFVPALILNSYSFHTNNIWEPTFNYRANENIRISIVCNILFASINVETFTKQMEN